MRRLIVIATHAIIEMGSKNKKSIYGSMAPKNDCKRFTGAKVRIFLEKGISNGSLLRMSRDINI